MIEEEENVCSKTFRASVKTTKSFTKYVHVDSVPGNDFDDGSCAWKSFGSGGVWHGAEPKISAKKTRGKYGKKETVGVSCFWK